MRIHPFPLPPEAFKPAQTKVRLASVTIEIGLPGSQIGLLIQDNRLHDPKMSQGSGGDSDVRRNLFKEETAKPIFSQCGCWEELCSPYAGAKPQPNNGKNLASMGPGILSSIGVGVWRKAPEALPDSNTTLDTSQSLRNLEGQILSISERFLSITLWQSLQSTFTFSKNKKNRTRDQDCRASHYLGALNCRALSEWHDLRLKTSTKTQTLPLWNPLWTRRRAKHVCNLLMRFAQRLL